jgi:hypothetical protein
MALYSNIGMSKQQRNIRGIHTSQLQLADSIQTNTREGTGRDRVECTRRTPGEQSRDVICLYRFAPDVQKARRDLCIVILYEEI